jgi:RNA polymerase sigma factor (sigma-70 family)
MEKAYEFKSRLMGYFANRLHGINQDDLEDLVSETFIYAGNYIDKVDDSFPIRLFKMARGVLLNYITRVTRHPVITEHKNDDGLEHYPEREVLTDYYDISGLNWNMIFEKIMQKLSNKERTFVRLVLDGYTLGEIKKKLRYSSKKSASVIWRKILKKMRKEMEAMGFATRRMKCRIRREDYGKRRVHRKGRQRIRREN